MKPFTLETERLLIRPFRRDDAAEVLAFSSHPEVVKSTGDTMRTTLEEVYDIIDNTWLKEYTRYGYARYAVIHKEDQKVIGFNGLKYLPEIVFPEFGYRFLPEYWGQGIATESSRAVLNYAFQEFPVNKILGFTLPNNQASMKVLEKLGFLLWKLAPYPGDDNDLNIHWYHLLRENYERS